MPIACVILNLHMYAIQEHAIPPAPMAKTEDSRPPKPLQLELVACLVNCFVRFDFLEKCFDDGVTKPKQRFEEYIE